MANEILLAATLVFVFSSLLAFYWLFGKAGAVAFASVAALVANIEVVMLVEAFGMEMTLGNILFASTFLATDILSECHSKDSAQKAVFIGIAVSLFFALLSQSWLMYQPSPNDMASGHFHAIFSLTPRIAVVSLLVYALAQCADVYLYHKVWALTEKWTGSRRSLLWLRNNLCTLASQALNAALFNLGAFWGVYPASTVWSLAVSTFAIYIATSLLDTPFLYAARAIKASKEKKERGPGSAIQKSTG
ncbi:MAG: queuosine precursor transporter [Eubacteriaceae bacterium]|nr:queuosine precursor transporter [Eubacteriaceae bacterium]